MEHFRELVQSPEFLARKGLANEIPYFIFDYPPQQELVIRDYVRNLQERLEISIVEINLFRLLLEFFDREAGVAALLELEANEGTKELFAAIEPILEDDGLVQIIAAMGQNADVVFLTGVGSVYPIVRSHTVLNRLQHFLVGVPVVMFYPGVYDGSEFRLFGLSKDDNYYRAFRIVPESI